MPNVSRNSAPVHDEILIPPELDEIFDLGLFADDPFADDDRPPAAPPAPHPVGIYMPPAVWLGDQASYFRSHECPLSDWLAGKIDALAEDWRATGANDPEIHDGRMEALDAPGGGVLVNDFPPAAATVRDVERLAKAECPGEPAAQMAVAFGSLRFHFERLHAEYTKLAREARYLQFRLDSCECDHAG